MPSVDCGFQDVPGGASGAILLASYGPTLKVDIGFDAAWSNTSADPPTPSLKDVHALVDTGASTCCVDSQLAAQLNLPVVDRIPISGISGRSEANIHVVQIHVPSLGVTFYGRFAGVELRAGGQRHDALIGRDFLRHFTMMYEGKTGTVNISN
jgi:hypothetical protein